MAKVNKNFLKLPGSYLFSRIAQKVAKYQEEHPEAEIIRLGIGDVTRPIAPAVINALNKAVEEMGNEGTFKGYAPDLGYEFLRKAIAENDFASRGCDISPDEIFVSDGALGEHWPCSEPGSHPGSTPAGCVTLGKPRASLCL